MYHNGRFCPPVARQRMNKLSASEGFTHWPPDQRLCPWTTLWASAPQIPVIGSRSPCKPPNSNSCANCGIRHETWLDFWRYSIFIYQFLSGFLRQTKARYTLPALTGREHGCQKMTPVFTDGVGRQRYTGDQHGPWTRVVCIKLKGCSTMVETVIETGIQKRPR